MRLRKGARSTSAACASVRASGARSRCAAEGCGSTPAGLPATRRAWSRAGGGCPSRPTSTWRSVRVRCGSRCACPMAAASRLAPRRMVASAPGCTGSPLPRPPPCSSPGSATWPPACADSRRPACSTPSSTTGLPTRAPRRRACAAVSPAGASAAPTDCSRPRAWARISPSRRARRARCGPGRRSSTGMPAQPTSTLCSSRPARDCARTGASMGAGSSSSAPSWRSTGSRRHPRAA